MDVQKKALLAYLSVCLFWGSTYLAIRVGVRDFPPFLFSAFRFLFAGAIMLGFAKIKNYDFPKSSRSIKGQAIIGVLMLMGGTGLVGVAEKTLDSSIASLVVSTVPLFIAVIEIAILRRRSISFTGIAGLVMGFGGVAFLALYNHGTLHFDLKGMLTVLAASFFWSIGSIFSGTFQKDGHIVANIGIQMFFGSAGLFLIGFLSGELGSLHPSMDSILAIVYLIVFGSIVGYSSYIYALQVWPASRVGTYAYVNPVVALILGALILGETVNGAIVLAMCFVLTGVILVQNSMREKKSVKKVESAS